jgi:hypothetical protein
MRTELPHTGGVGRSLGLLAEQTNWTNGKAADQSERDRAGRSGGRIRQAKRNRTDASRLALEMHHFLERRFVADNERRAFQLQQLLSLKLRK